MRHLPARTVLLAGAIASAGAGCNEASGPASLQPVAFHLAVAPAASLGGAGGPLTITAVRLVAGPVALGSGDQFGCVDCQDGGPELLAAPRLLTVPLDGSAVTVATEPVAAGHYSAAEIALLAPDRGLLGANPGWPDTATVEISGAFQGTPFVLDLAIQGSFRETLIAPVIIAAGAVPTSVDVTISLPVASWFEAGGASLDPNNPGQRAQIVRNAASAFHPPEVSAGGGPGHEHQ